MRVHGPKIRVRSAHRPSILFQHATPVSVRLGHGGELGVSATVFDHVKQWTSSQCPEPFIGSSDLHADRL